MLKLWHDDMREPPDDSWTWAKTNFEAIDLLKRSGVCQIASLDHDLGFDEQAIPLQHFTPQRNGLDLARWMGENHCFPQMVILHSWSPVGAQNQANALADAGFSNYDIAPYDRRNYT